MVPPSLFAGLVEAAIQRQRELLIPIDESALRRRWVADEIDDDFVGVCHAVIAGIAPDARIVDLSHGIPRHDVRTGATEEWLPEGADGRSTARGITTDEDCVVDGGKVMQAWHELRFAQRHQLMSSMALGRRVRPVAPAEAVGWFGCAAFTPPSVVERVAQATAGPRRDLRAPSPLPRAVGALQVYAVAITRRRPR